MYHVIVTFLCTVSKPNLSARIAEAASRTALGDDARRRHTALGDTKSAASSVGDPEAETGAGRRATEQEICAHRSQLLLVTGPGGE